MADVAVRTTPWWVRVLAVFVASRVVTTALLLWFASKQGANAWTDPQPGYFDFARIWDAHWYFIIAVSGYPSVLPVTDTGAIGENAWAFMPGYPSLVRALMLVTGVDFPVVGVLVSVAFAAGTSLLLYRLFEKALGPGTALFSVVLFCVAPLSPIYQVAYAESMHTFFLVLALLLLQNRQYWLMIPVIAVMALTRPSGLAFALALLLHLGYRWWKDPDFPWRERIAVMVVGLFSAFMGIVWLLAAWYVTGSPSAYTDTELAWRAGYGFTGELVPFEPWMLGAQFWLQFPAGPLIVGTGILFIVGFLWLVVVSRGARRIGVDTRFWLVSYLLYLLAVFFPQSSTFRLLVPLFPVLGIVAQSKSPLYRVGIVIVFIIGQYLWLQATWLVDGSDWTPP